MACKQAAMSWIFNGAGFFIGITYAGGNALYTSLKNYLNLSFLQHSFLNFCPKFTNLAIYYRIKQNEDNTHSRLASWADIL